MSSTNRGRPRKEADFYPTPPWVTKRLFERLDGLPSEGIWYEPCAGEGAIVQAANTIHADLQWWANEPREEVIATLAQFVPRDCITTGSFLQLEADRPPAAEVRVVVTNPPFRIAYEVIQVALQRFPRAYVIVLLRLNFVSTKGRHAFMQGYMPDIYVVPNRPSFTGEGTDSPEYAWFVWGPTPRRRRRGGIEVLDLTDSKDRALLGLVGGGELNHGSSV